MDWPRAAPLTTSRLLLEPLTEDHAREMVVVLAPPDLYVYTGGEPPTEEKLRRRYAVQSVGQSPAGDAGWLNWIVRRADTREAVGYVQATLTTRDAEAGQVVAADVAWLITPTYQGNGYAAEAARTMIDWLHRQGVGVIHAAIHPEHRASERVARRLGLEPTGAVADGESVWQGAPLR